MLRRFHAVLAAVLVALALAAVPAFAQDDDDDDDDAGAVPEGGVQTGGGGTADDGSAGVLLGLGAGTLVLVATAGGLAVRRRMQE
jgi:hypothetical protein